MTPFVSYLLPCGIIFRNLKLIDTYTARKKRQQFCS